MSSNVSNGGITFNNTLNKEIRSLENKLIKSQETNDKKNVTNTTLPSLPSTIIIKGDNEKIQDNNSCCCIHELLSNDPILKTQVCNLM
ncbi:Hypothetical protein SRAE_1000148500 [Strongyloides ratti]|uniref:Uncharacterized protein n=1 Tax=Strongyloides ratti TaxID=34506 RepID=A0A090L567_STRRB|nr:Hypothetical protein SRAE_1000148500 [Strongyloides ratti]CEF63222.1 Hypothetical protein SRAE_1000148500 [Strongyloides ratti]